MYMYVKTILKNYHTMLFHLYFKCRNKNSLLCIIFSMSFNQPNLKILLNSMSILSVLFVLITCSQILSCLSIFFSKLLYISMSPCSSQINSEPILSHKCMPFFSILVLSWFVEYKCSLFLHSIRQTTHLI